MVQELVFYTAEDSSKISYLLHKTNPTLKTSSLKIDHSNYQMQLLKLENAIYEKLLLIQFL